MRRRITAAVVSTIALSFIPIASAQHPLSIADLKLLHSVGAPQLSPDGRTIAVSISRTDYDTGERQGGIELVEVETGETDARIEGGSPQWSPDGARLAYLGAHDGRRGLIITDVATLSETTFLAEIHSADHFLGHRSDKNWAWSPDGRWIAYIGAEPPDARNNESDVRVFTRTLYKTRTGFSDNRTVHIWIVATDGRSAPRCLTPGKYDEHSLTWSPDSRTIAFCSNRSPDPDLNYRDDIYTVDIATGQVTQRTDTPGTETTLAWSPDGRWIAYHGTVRPLNTKDSPPEDTQLYILPAEGGQGRCLTQSLDRRVGDFAWHPSGESIYFIAGDRGMRPIFRVGVESGSIERLIDGPFAVNAISLDAAGESVAVTVSAPAHPTEVWIADADIADFRMVTNYQRDFTQRVTLQDQEEFWFDSFDGTRVQGWVVRPAGFEPGRTYPAILSIHGGPHGMFSHGFSERIQWLAAHGYGVVFINPRGSSGYGQAFSDGCVLNWGGGDYKDLMLGLDHAIAAHEWIDPERLGVIGGSYGGFMTNWVVTQTNRFKAAIAIASVSNLVSFYGTSLYQLLIEVEFNGMPWDNYDLLWQWSPLKHIRNVTTPTLLIHGEVDHDVPIGQAEEMYIALKKLGVDTMLVRYPGEGHGFRQVGHQRDSMQRTIEWFDKYLK